MKSFRFISLLVLIALIASACASTPTPAPTSPPAAVATDTTAPTMAPTNPPAPTDTPVPPTPTLAPPTNTPAPTAVAQIPPEKLSQKGHLLICTDFPYPPQEFFDDNGNPQGLDVEIGTEIANRLGLKVQFVNSVFDTIIAAVTSGKCDIIISAQNVTPDRQKQVSMIPYFKAGQSFVALKGNPQNINGPMDLCGKSAAAESGTTEAFYISGTDLYKDKGLTQACVKAGKQPITLVVTQKDTDALQQLIAGKVAVYSADSPVAAYYTVQHPDQFQLVGQVLEAAQEGISVPCGAADCTNAPLTEVGKGVQAALKSMMADGTYMNILKKWNLTDSSVSP
jgi:polar amino acid transport system substrate-binding protein